MTTPELLAIADQQGLNLNELVREMMDRLAEIPNRNPNGADAPVDGQMRLF
jgi:hypothetical protein